MKAPQNSTRPIESAHSLSLALSLSLSLSRSLVREFRNFANARPLTPKAFRRIKFSRIVYDKMFPFNLSNHHRVLQTFVNFTGGRDQRAL
jgi:hypothetical protein